MPSPTHAAYTALAIALVALGFSLAAFSMALVVMLHGQ